jgi:hypothetical protein
LTTSASSAAVVGGQPDAGRRQAEIDHEDLDQEGRVADRLDIFVDEPLQPFRARCLAERAEHRATTMPIAIASPDSTSVWSSALQQLRPRREDVGEFELVAHAADPILAIISFLLMPSPAASLSAPGPRVDRN